MKIKAQIDRMVGENNRIKAYASVILGGEYVEKRLKGSKAGDKVLALGDGKKLSVLFLVRFLPVFPIDFVSLFLGATKLPYWKYALISLGGIMPRVILFTILGDGISATKRKTHLPVEPNPPSPRSVSSRLSTSTG